MQLARARSAAVRRKTIIYGIMLVVLLMICVFRRTVATTYAKPGELLRGLLAKSRPA
jgi:hypothetical protein